MIAETFCFFIEQDQGFVKFFQFYFLIAKFNAGIRPVRSIFEDIFKRCFCLLGEPHGSINFSHIIITFCIQLVQFDKFSAFLEGSYQLSSFCVRAVQTRRMPICLGERFHATHFFLPGQGQRVLRNGFKRFQTIYREPGQHDF